MIFFFLFQNTLKNNNHGQYGSTCIVHLGNIDQFLFQAHITNSDQDKIGIESYCSFKVSHIFSSKSAIFCYLKYF